MVPLRWLFGGGGRGIYTHCTNSNWTIGPHEKSIYTSLNKTLLIIYMGVPRVSKTGVVLSAHSDWHENTHPTNMGVFNVDRNLLLEDSTDQHQHSLSIGLRLTH